MNLDQRYRCVTHPNVTVGATEGETEPPSCQFCRQPMVPVATANTPAAEKPSQTRRDPRAQRPPRPEGHQL